MWIVSVKRQSQNGVKVILLEVRLLQNGVLITTGRRTPTFAFDISRGNYEAFAGRLRKSLEILTAESMFQQDEEALLVAAEMAEQLRDVVGGVQDGEDRTE